MAENINITLENLSKEDKEILFNIIGRAHKKQELSKVENGETFNIDGIPFIKFAEIDGATIVMTKDIFFDSEFGENNNLANMEIINKLQKEFVPKIAAAIGAENILDFETDLTTLDGVKTYGKITSNVSLPTLDFYRKYTEIFDKFKLDRYFWLATPWSDKPHYDSSSILCVSPSGVIGGSYYDDVIGVRPLLYLKSSIFVSLGD